jgi:phage tail sheath gpL-like
MPTLSVIFNTPKDPTEFTKTDQPRMNMIRLVNLVKGFQVGAQIGSVSIYSATANPVAATGTITLATAVATNTVTIGQTVFTFTASPSSNTATAVDVLVTGTDTVVAAALAAAINNNTLGAGAYIVATSALGVVTISCRIPGTIGNNILLAKSGAPITLSGSYMTTGAGGPAGAPVVIGRN